MKRIVSLLVFFIQFIPFIAAQSPAEIFAWHRDSLPIERIYIQFDRQAYVAGETAWFKAYVLSGSQGGTISTNFYINLLDENGKAIVSKKLPVLENTVSGNLDLPASLNQGIYLVRAYSPWSLNFGTAFVFKKALPVFNSSNSSNTSKPNKEFSFETFPEGGQLVSGLPNNIAFQAMNRQGQPVPVKARLEDSKGTNQGDFASGSASSGIFSLTPVFKEKYFAVVQFPDQSIKRYELHPAIEEGVTLTVADHEMGKAFSALVTQSLADAELHLIAVMDNEIVLNTALQLTNNEASGVISAKTLHSGILHLFLFDKQNKMLAERTTVIQNDQSSPAVQLRTDTFNSTPKAKNIFSFLFQERMTGNLSVSVTDADRELISKNDQEISSSLLLQSGTAQYISIPESDNEEAMDLLMLSHNWYGSDWPSLTTRTTPRYRKDHYLSFKGKVFEQAGMKAIGEGELDLVIQPENGLQKSYNVSISADGYVGLDSLLFEDSARIYYEMAAGKKNKDHGAIKLIPVEPDNNYSGQLLPFDYSSYINGKQLVFENTNTVRLAGELQQDVLAEHLVKLNAQGTNTTTATKERSSKKSTDKRYASGMFSTSRSRTIDLLADPPTNQGINIFDYLQGRVGGLIIEKAGQSRYNLWNNRSRSTNEVVRGNPRGMVPGKVYLNDMESSSDVVASTAISQFALVKYFEPGSIMLPGIGISSVLAFWTKQQEDQQGVVSPGMKNFIVPGYSPSLQFFSPDYSSGPKKVTDKRVTLLWNPRVSLNNEKEVKIVFWNTDITKRFHIILEGVTADGRPVHFDKIIE